MQGRRDAQGLRHHAREQPVQKLAELVALAGSSVEKSGHRSPNVADIAWHSIVSSPLAVAASSRRLDVLP